MIIGKSKNDKFLTELTLDDAPTVRPVMSDQPVEHGGLGESMRPNQLLQAGYAACMSMSARGMLAEEGLAFDEVLTYVDMDHNQETGVTKFLTKVEIIGDIPQDKKDEIIQKARKCFISRVLASEKEFGDL